MTFPETCPHCDAGPGPYVNSYLCGTYLRAGYDAKKHQTKRCVTRQIHTLKSEAKQAREDEEWAHERSVLVDFAPLENGWNASVWNGEKVITTLAPTIHAALCALRAKVEGGTR